jgi:[acyl-carrier-protein] S-malonyltransferase
MRVVERAKEFGGRGVKLDVSGPFHSTFMDEVSDNLKEVIEDFPFREAKIPVVTNVWAEPLTSSTELKEALVLQVKSPVLWERSIRRMIDEGVSTFVEIGPGKVLTKLIHRIDAEVRTFSVENTECMDAFLRSLNELEG